MQERFLGLADRDDPYDVEFRVILASGVRHLRTRTEVTRDATGQALETFCLAQDITHLHQSRERLLHTRQGLADERRLALRLQRIILPVPDEPLDLPGIHVGVRYIPAGEASQVGGDWYHAMALQDGSVLLAVGDVAGHGLAAASVMAQLRHALTGLAAAGSSPAAALRVLNTIMCEHVPEHTLSTAVIARYQPDTRRLTWAQAGHLPSMLIRGARTHLLDRPEGLVLGAHHDVKYATAQATLRPGDLLLMYTDGLVERPDLTIDAGIAELAAACAAAAARAGSAGTDRSAAVLRAVRPANLGDDACLLVAETIDG